MLPVAAVVAAASLLSACGPGTKPATPALRLATTTSTVDSGLFKALLPAFESQCGCRVDVVAVGTGQALELGRRGDADVLLVHAPEQEAAFMKEGHAARRDDVMYNDFVIVGPVEDPAGVTTASMAKDAFRSIQSASATFASRGDKSGTHTKELALWKSAGATPAAGASWYLSVGQGMGETLTFANERKAYALTDRATWTSMQRRLPNLRLLFGGASADANPDRDLRNRYGVIVIDQARHAGVNTALGLRFADWLLSKPTQQQIGAFGRDAAGHSLFYPDSGEFKSTDQLRVVIGEKSRTFTLDDLRKAPQATLAAVEHVGVKKGALGKHTWTGASLKDLLLSVDPDLAAPPRSASTIEVISRDGWVATLTWQELFGQISRGEGLFLAKGCNECHGLRAEGTSPEGKRPAPKLMGQAFPVAETTAMIRAGTGQHEGITAYTAERLSDAELAAILGWFAKPAPTGKADPFVVPEARRPIVLAYERDGKPMTGREGLIQLVVGADQFASRYSHWVSEVRVR
jgi:tungstate transport system substrate-binding protein